MHDRSTTLSERIRESLSSGSAPAFEVDAQWRSWSDVSAVADRVHALLSESGMGEAAPVGLVGRNRIGSAAAFLAILAADCCVVPINPHQQLERLLEDLSNLDLCAVVCEPEDLQSGALVDCAKALGIGLIAVEGLDPHAVRLVLAPETGRPMPHSGHCALLIPTSGTTGIPKRVPIRFDTLMAANADAETSMIEFGEPADADTNRSPLIQYSPLVHITGALSVSRCGSERRRLVLLEKFTPAAWVDAVERNAIAIAGLPPTMMRMVLSLDPPAERLASLRTVWSGSSPVDGDVVDRFEKRYGVTVVGNYGATEFCGVVASGRVADRAIFGNAKRASVGRIKRQVADFRVLEPNGGEPATPGATGILEVRVHRVGPEWMRTSDLVSIDEDDFLYVHGRADDAINRGGFKVLPSIIIDALRKHPQVEDVAVVGLPDVRLGEVPVAAVELKSGRTTSSEELLHFGRKELIAYQVPTQIKIVSALPRTPSLKIDKAGVKALFARDG